MIRMTDVQKHFGELHVLRDINLEVDTGQVRSARGGVALVEEQVQDLAHRAKARGRVGGELEAAPSQRGLRPADALRHGRLGDEERRGDLCRRQATNGPQGERELRCG